MLIALPGLPRVRDRLLMLSNMTSNFAGVPLAFAYIILLGNNGVFTLLFKQWGWSVFADFDLYSWSGLILVYVYFQVPLALLLLYPSFYGIREQWREAASLLGGWALAVLEDDWPAYSNSGDLRHTWNSFC